MEEQTLLTQLNSKLSLEKESTKNKIQKLLDFLKNISYNESEAIQLAGYGRYLQNLGKAIENEVGDKVVDYLSANEMNMDVSDLNLSYREYYDKIYPKDSLLLKYEEAEEKILKELSEIRESIKNRKQFLEQEGQVVKILKNRSLSIRQK